MTPTGSPSPAQVAVAAREHPVRALAEQADTVSRACHAMATRFHAGATLLVFGSGGPAADAHHVAVEFLHPVIVGKHALPALSLAADTATLLTLARATEPAEVFAAQLAVLARPGDIALGLSSGADPAVRRGLEVARGLGMLTVELTAGEAAEPADPGVAEYRLVVPTADPRVAKEVHVTAYHILWELVHIYLEQPGLFPPASSP